MTTGMKRLIQTIFCTALICSRLFSQNNNLEYYVTQAMASSPLLKDYQYQQQSGQLDSQRIRAANRPQVNGSTFNSYAPVIGGVGYDQAISNGGAFATLVSVNKTIVSKKNLNTQFETLHLQNESLKNTAKISEQDLIRTVTAQYITAFGIMQQLNFNRDILALLKKEEVILKTLTERNVYRQTDYLTFLVTLQQQGLLCRQLQIQYQNEFGTLNYLAGINDTSSVWLQEPSIRLSGLPQMYNSVFFRQFEIDSLKLTNSRALVDFSYRPKTNLFADAGFNSSLAYTPYRNFGTSFGFSVTVPIYDGHQRKLQYSKINLAELTRNAYQQFFTSQYRQQIAQLTQQLHATDELIGQISEQIRYSESLIQVNGKLLETGDARIADYIIALNNYLNAKNLLTQNDITRYQIINQINYWNR